MIDRTDQTALQRIKEIYGDQIEDYEYKSWKEAYLANPPPRAFCSSFTRYRDCYKVTHVKLKDGRKIPVGSVGCGCTTFIMTLVFIISIVIIWLL